MGKRLPVRWILKEHDSDVNSDLVGLVELMSRAAMAQLTYDKML